MRKSINIYDAIKSTQIIDIMAELVAKKTGLNIEASKQKIDDMFIEEINKKGQELINSTNYDEEHQNKLKSVSLDDFLKDDIKIIKDQ